MGSQSNREGQLPNLANLDERITLRASFPAHPARIQSTDGISVVTREWLFAVGGTWSEISENHGNLKKGFNFNFKNVFKLFCIDSGWIPVEGTESIGGGELPAFFCTARALFSFKIQPRASDCSF